MTDEDREDKRRAMSSLHIAKMRTSKLTDDVSDFLDVIADQVSRRFHSQGDREKDLHEDPKKQNELFELAILSAVLEGRLESDTKQFKQVDGNKRSFEIVASLEYLGGLVATILDTLIDTDEELRPLASTTKKNTDGAGISSEFLEFYTIQPVSPKKFLNHAKWNESAVDAEPADRKSEQWIKYLQQCERATLAEFKVHRHFVAVTDEYVTDQMVLYAAFIKSRVAACYPSPSDEVEALPTVLWNPLAHDSEEDLPRVNRVAKEFNGYVSLKNIALDEKDAASQYGIIDRLKKIETKESGIFKVCQKNNCPEGTEGFETKTVQNIIEDLHSNGCAKVITMEKNCPFENTLLEKAGSRYLLVSYFAAWHPGDISYNYGINGRIKTDPNWVFIIRSFLDPDTDTVRVKIMFRAKMDENHQDYDKPYLAEWNKEVKKLDKLFAAEQTKDGASHILTIDDFIKKNASDNQPASPKLQSPSEI